MEHILFRAAKPGDEALILEFIMGLAVYEHLEDAVEATVEGLTTSLFEERAAEVIFCEADGIPVGFALFFQNFSTFTGRPGIYLEDLFVKPEHRGKGYGKMLIKHIAGIAIMRRCARFEWACLDWNEPSIAFYKHLGAVPLSDWTVYRVAGEALDALAKP